VLRQTQPSTATNDAVIEANTGAQTSLIVDDLGDVVVGVSPDGAADTGHVGRYLETSIRASRG